MSLFDFITGLTIRQTLHNKHGKGTNKSNRIEDLPKENKIFLKVLLLSFIILISAIAIIELFK